MIEVLKGKTLLIVDDERDLREPLAMEFESLGCKVFQASNGREAFELVKSEKIDVVISDIRMPGGDGIELLKRIKEFQHSFPVVMLITGFSDLSNEDAYHLGAEAVLAKPFDLDALDAAVIRLLTPREVRWQDPVAEEKIKKCIERSFEALDDAVAKGEIALGRGGIFLNEETPFRGETVAFQIKFKTGSVLSLDGHGSVRWSRKTKESELPSGCGIEFEYLSDEVRLSVLELIDRARTVPFIPRGPVGV